MTSRKTTEYARGSKKIGKSPERDSNTRPIDYKSIALDQLSYRGAEVDYFISLLKGFAPKSPPPVRNDAIPLCQPRKSE